MPDTQGHPSPDEINLGTVLSALADTNRRQVIHDLALATSDEARTCTSFGLPVSKSTLSHHFKVLRESGLVRQVDLGNMSGVTLRREDIDERFPGLLNVIASDEPAS